jgi:hypothetical protein
VKIRVNVSGAEISVVPRDGWNIGAVATNARWLTGYGTIPADNWEIRDDNGVLLDPSAPLGPVTELWVNRLPGIGG